MKLVSFTIVLAFYQEHQNEQHPLCPNEHLKNYQF